MKVLLKSATIVDASSAHHQKKCDILIEGGKIKQIKNSIDPPAKCRIVSLENLHVSPGWFDSSVSLGEPGFEERETLKNGLMVAAKSGFTSIALNANTYPVTDSKGHIKYLKSASEDSAVSLYPIGALTIQSKGVDLAELFDMQNEGAIAFYDYKSPVENPNLLKIALQYSQNFEGLIQSFPFEKAVARKGVVNEEVNSTLLGLKGIPALSEELQIIRDLYILEYTGGKLHIPTISTRKSVDLIADAKKRGLQVSCSVSVFNLLLTDDILENFDTNYKLLPPLRTSEDNNALIDGLKAGIIDGVTSDHNPIDVEHKNTEFEQAYFGSIGMESAFGALTAVLDMEDAVKALVGLKQIFNLPSHSIKEGEVADISLFNPEKKWVFGKEDIISTSKNSAFLGVELKGRPYGIIAKNKMILNE